MASEEEIRKLAYDMWEKEGRPNGKDWEHYYKAKRILEEREDLIAHMTEDVGAANTLELTSMGR
jgi:hypothetical protein